MEPIIVKVGGGEGVNLEAVCQDVAALVRTSAPVVLMHGTSAAADALALRTGVPVRQLVSPSGHVSRYTDPEMLDIYVAAAAGQMNKRLVSLLQGMGCDAVGLSGLDGRLLQAQRKGAVRTMENGRQRIVRDDYTGKLKAANGQLLQLLMSAGYTPVVAPLAIGHEAEPLNVDGDRAAALLATTLGASTLIILSNVPGLLADLGDEGSLVKHVSRDSLAQADQLAQGRMKKKILAAQEALAGGVHHVVLADSRRPTPIQTALAGGGTWIGETPGGLDGEW